MIVIAIVQARMSSTRFPGKVLKPVSGTTVIGLLLKRLSHSKNINKIVVATSTDPSNRELVEYVQGLGYVCEIGSEDDVLHRFVDVAEKHGADVVVRITGDCPLVDFELVDSCISSFLEQNVDYLSNIDPPLFPDGLDIEVCRFTALQRALTQTKSPFDREHVTPFIRLSGKFSKASIKSDVDYSARRWTVDEPIDLEIISRIVKHFSPRIDFKWKEIIHLQDTRPEFFDGNQNIKRNQGSLMGKGQKLWQRAKRIIPGGNMLLSKRPEMFLPDYWPAYFSKAEGCTVWDLDGNQFCDMSIMGVGTNILGYGHPEVDQAVRQIISAGNMSTLNCPEEVYLAEKLVDMHPWADMVRFARTGGEANAIAVRIARAATGLDHVAICGYHGWHDWYLSANLSVEDSLNGHLLPGLQPKGVPRELCGTVFTFSYNNIDELERIVNTHKIGAIKMEVQRNEEPKNDFLVKVRKLASEKNIVLIFDECTSGFRETNGGLHKKYGVEPDMAIFGKALGNGYAITAVLGRSEIMQAAQSSFISSTFWTERIGPAAALKTIEIMERDHTWDLITEIGLRIRLGWQKLADKYDIKIFHWGLPALAGFSFQSANAMSYKTLITQEMLSKGFLAGNSVYVCIHHNQEILEKYFEALDSVFALISECEDGQPIHSMLNGPVCHAGFKRLN